MTSLPILLPYGFSPLVKENDAVNAGQMIAKLTAPQEEIVNIARDLGISLRKAKKVLLKSPGESIAKGEIIALHKKFLGFSKEAIVSKVSGTIVKYERDTGDLYIRTSYANLTDNFVSPVDGIVRLCDNEKIVIDVDKNVIMGTNATEAKGEGELFIFEASSSPNQLFLIDNTVTGKIVVAESLSRESLTKGIALGASGFVSKAIELKDIEYVRQKHADVPVMDVDAEALAQLIAWKNKKVYVDGQAKSIILLHV